MKTDRELLELAAKVAGRNYAIGHDWHDEGSFYVDGRQWNPMEDDGDALRLAGKLELDIMHRVVGGSRVEVLPPGGPLTVVRYIDDRMAAIRRAIVEAAATVQEKKRQRTNNDRKDEA